ncbi:hypothetical protein O181_024699 [Austropuccinia psidii MF-1]|uniref:Reverse transcriptase Ty1/copia-type domain-containing protein n=1 Tax=Austropuccinia psidii MF-1 TaxID=1389203 RepID=A0A9Q3CJ49_9BASI|nr:hypothetical protein [Austropuccinia psidii MF-1]
MELPYVIFTSDNKKVSLEADTSDLILNSTPEEDVLYYSLEELPVRRIKVIGPRNPTMITSDISTNSILPFRWKNHNTTKKEHEKAPNNFKKATQGKDALEWKEAIIKELEKINRLNVWTIVDRKPSDHPITTTWVFKVKRD